MKNLITVGLLLGLSACAHVPAASEEDYYRLVETKVGSTVSGVTARESRETFCPNNRTHGDDPQYWPIDQWAQHLKAKDCIQIVCRTSGAGTQCKENGDLRLKKDLESHRKKVSR
jgi:hypothetical protein